MYRHYKRGFSEALAGYQIDPPDDVTKQVRGCCDERSHYIRGIRDGQKHRRDLLITPCQGIGWHEIVP